MSDTFFENMNESLRPFLQTATGVSCDTRTLTSGDIFVAVPSQKSVDFCREASRLGACLIVCDEQTATALSQNSPAWATPLLVVPNPRLTLAFLASHFYPKIPDHLVAVTGTNGKSSVVNFTRQLWEALGYTAASLGTLGVESTVPNAAGLQTQKLTTPDAVHLRQLLQTLSTFSTPITHLAFEASSHGLDQYRLHGTPLRAAGFTNLTQDHLDYHASMDAYFHAKSRLFTEILPPSGVAVVNADSPYCAPLMMQIPQQTILTYGVTNPNAMLRAENIRLYPARMMVDIVYEAGRWTDITLHMVGNFQIENILCAIGLVSGCGVPIAQIMPHLGVLRSAKGRMDYVGTPADHAAVFVDYAHTPDALERSLCALRAHVLPGGKLSVVFGCGGNRDAGKRKIMGEIAERHADIQYITDDNPRFEEPAYIRAQILSGCPSGIPVADRAQAIDTAIRALKPRDILLIAGKGHEIGQIIGHDCLPFSDHDVATRCLETIAASSESTSYTKEVL